MVDLKRTGSKRVENKLYKHAFERSTYNASIWVAGFIVRLVSSLNGEDEMRTHSIILCLREEQQAKKRTTGIKPLKKPIPLSNINGSREREIDRTGLGYYLLKSNLVLVSEPLRRS